MKGRIIITLKNMEQITLDIEDTSACIYALSGITMIVVNMSRSLSYNTSDIVQIEMNDYEGDE